MGCGNWKTQKHPKQYSDRMPTDTESPFYYLINSSDQVNGKVPTDFSGIRILLSD